MATAIPPTPDEESPLDRLRVAGKNLGRDALKHFPTVVAVAALLFYAVGLFRRIVQLERYGVGTTQGLSLTPLEDNFVAGLAAVFDPSDSGPALMLLLAIGGLGAGWAHIWWPYVSQRWIARADDDAAAGGSAGEQPADQEQRVQREHRRDPAARAAKGSRPPRRARIGRALSLLASFVVMVVLPVAAAALVPVAYLAPILGVGVILTITWLSVRQPPRAWTEREARRVMTGIVAAIVVGIVADGVARFPPLNWARLELEGKQRREGSLLAIENGVMYLAGERRCTPGSRAPIEAVPIAKVVRSTITRPPPQYRETVFETGNQRFYRIEWPADGWPEIRRGREPPTRSKYGLC